MKLSKLLILIITLVIFSTGCTVKSQKMKEAKILEAKAKLENRKDIEELEARANAMFFEPDLDVKGSTRYELDKFLSTKPSQRFIIQDPKILEVYPNGDLYDVYLYLGPNVTPKIYSYIFKIEKMRKDDLDSLLAGRNDDENRIFLVLKKLEVTSSPPSETESSRISKQVIIAEYGSLVKVASIKSLIATKADKDENN